MWYVKICMRALASVDMILQTAKSLWFQRLRRVEARLLTLKPASEVRDLPAPVGLLATLPVAVLARAAFAAASFDLFGLFD